MMASGMLLLLLLSTCYTIWYYSYGLVLVRSQSTVAVAAHQSAALASGIPSYFHYPCGY